MKSYNQAQFEAALMRGQHDFSGAEFTGHIRIDQDSRVNLDALPRIILDKAHLGPDFVLGRWKNPVAALSMEGAVSEGRVALLHLNIYRINLGAIEVQKWLAVMHSEAEAVCLAGAKLAGGFTAKNTCGGRLDLTGCHSTQSLFSAENFRTVEADDAHLGKLTPTTLGELAEQ